MSSPFRKGIAALLLLIATAAAPGCLHTWTGTYQEFPESINSPTHAHQANPESAHP